MSEYEADENKSAQFTKAQTRFARFADKLSLVVSDYCLGLL